VSGVLAEERILEGTSNEGFVLIEELVLDRTSDEEMFLEGPDGQEGGFIGVMERKERYWMRFLKGMVTDRNTNGPRKCQNNVDSEGHNCPTDGRKTLRQGKG
jgi:hypothetical protein